jgi:enoyl-CoA hydratase/carnithine racemase
MIETAELTWVPWITGPVTVDRRGGEARVTLRRPEKLNALDNGMVEALFAVATALAADEELRLVTIIGAGRAFCSGLDVDALAAGRLGERFFRTWERALRLFEVMDKVVVCVMHGYAIGGGLQLGLACDVRVATVGCRLGLPAVKEAIIPGLSFWRLPRHIGLGHAKRMITGGATVDGPRALEIGLVDHLVADADRQAERLCAEYLDTCSQAVRLGKELMARTFELDFEAAFQEHLRVQKECLGSADSLEARTAHREGRSPRWR